MSTDYVYKELLDLKLRIMELEHKENMRKLSRELAWGTVKFVALWLAAFAAIIYLLP